LLLRLVPDDTKFPFMRWRRIFFPLSAIVTVVSLGAFMLVGLNLGIDFRGGTLIEVQSRRGPADLGAMRTTLGKLNLGDVQLQEFGSPRDILIRFEQQPGGDAAQQAVVERVRQTLGDQFEFRRIEVVGPTVSGELLRAGVIGVALSLFCIWIYLWFRFEWQFAVGAMIATLHDLSVIIGFYAITQIDFDLSAVAVVLTIAGYSLNDTVVVYDRIHDLLDLAINTTLPRTVITGATTFLALLGLTFFGGEVLAAFTQAMLVGVIIGIYSTTFIASPILIYLGVRTQTVGDTPGTAEAKAKAEAA
jgi:preprotein translocase subunit SecF